MTHPPRSAMSAAFAGQSLGLGVLHNRHSGRRFRQGTPRLPSHVPTYAVREPDDVATALTELADQDVRLVAIAGGDGTVQAALTHLLSHEPLERMPILAVAPTGSTNMTACDVGSVGNRRGDWQRLEAWARAPRVDSGQITTRPVLSVRSRPNAPPRCGMFFGAAVIYQAVAHTQGRLHRVGLRGDLGPGLAFMRFAQAIARGDRNTVSPLPVAIHDDHGRDLSIDTTLLFASTLHRLLLNLRPFWGDADDGAVRWTAIESGSRSFLANLPAICRGQPGNRLWPEHGYHSHNSGQLELTFDGGYILDGEFYQARADDGPVTIGCAGEAAFLNL